MAHSSFIIGVDLGGTKIALTRYNANTWEAEETNKMPTHADQKFENVLEDLVEAIQGLRTDETTAVGIGVPGLVNQPAGSIHTLPNIPGAEGVELKKILEEKLDLTVAVDNDANCFALAEALHGAGKDEHTVVGLTFGTGVGGGIVVDGKLLRGSHGFAGEIGHMLLMPGNPPFDAKDMRGDVEQFLSGSAMGKRCQQASSPNEYLEGATCSFMHPDIERETAWLCVNLTHLIDPAVIVIGGSAGRAMEPHLENIRREMSAWLLPGTPAPELRIAQLADPGTRGAALLI